ncbi:MAG: fumarate hydratase, partial [Candidatus Eisenbacteria sp.]|nr:fumarate hydratase [Candidatus Eisenbacteria bacterium]
MSAKDLQTSLLELVRRTSSDLPPDIEAVLRRSVRREVKGTTARYALDVIMKNIELARDNSLPICQDTGSLLFYLRIPMGFDEAALRKAADAAVKRATELGYLRQNSVDSLTGKNSGTNLGPGSPVYHFEQWKRKSTEVRLIQKGGGCENCGIQYALPNAALGAGRDIQGIEKCILDAVFKAQGKGCAPGALGVCIGGDRATGYAHSKEQLLRTLDDKNEEKTLAALESRVMKKANQLGIGP